jgi:hypothetical protein
MPTRTYEICLQEALEPRWAEWFEGLMLRPAEGGGTTLFGELPDQSALHGLLAQIRDLNLTLISVQQVENLEKQLGQTKEISC